MKILEEKDADDEDDILIIDSLTYYKLEFLTKDWILKRLYVSNPQIFLKE